MKVRWQFMNGSQIEKTFETNEQCPPQLNEWVRDTDSSMLYRVDRLTRIICPTKQKTIGVAVTCSSAFKLEEEPIHDAFDHQTKRIGTW